MRQTTRNEGDEGLSRRTVLDDAESVLNGQPPSRPETCTVTPVVGGWPAVAVAAWGSRREMRSLARGYHPDRPVAERSTRAQGHGVAGHEAIAGPSRTLGLRIALIASVFLAIAFALLPPASANDFLANFTQCDRPDATSCLNDQGGVTPPFPVGTTFTIQIIPGIFGGCDGQGGTGSVVDWGDGTPPTSGSGRALHTHTYEGAGSFVITMRCGGYVHSFDALPIGGGAFSLGGIFGLPETLRPVVAPIVIVGSGAAIVAMSLPIAMSPAAASGGAAGAGTLGELRPPVPLYEAAGSPGMAGQEPSPILGGGQPITGVGVHVGPIDVPPPPDPPLGPEDQTLVTCWRHPGVRCGPTPGQSPSGEQQWRWACPYGHQPWGSDYPQEYRLWKAGGGSG